MKVDVIFEGAAFEEEMEREENQDPEENLAIKIDMHEIEKNMDKWNKKVEAEREDINIFRYHPHFAKALSTTDIS